ncbi:SLC13 family permease [Microbacterium invictum]|uniref:ArsB/NhaD family transporter n=1 Tax=Microbacterium invictum TaxID=515415 RepID=A0ABZ0VA78_9MICO|nr:SLC13 family permease [Microbacterium invictum]WQB69015.1 ArsB/NhaD family transporter [Microbacterium invictum]
MKTWMLGLGLLAAGAVALLTGVLPASDLLAVADRVWSILLFVVAITVVAELAATAGVFDIAAAALSRLARGRTLLLWMLVVALAVGVTVFLSLDTTAVLLTPVVLAVARSHRLDPLPFALATVWIANTASLLLPISNLTNLLAVERISGGDILGFVALMWPAALTSILVSVALLFVVFRRRLRGRHEPAAPPVVTDRVQLRIAAGIVIVLLPLLVSGIPPWIPACLAALALVALFAWRSPRRLGPSLVPWSLLVFVSGLFVAVAALEALGALQPLEALIGPGDSAASLAGIAGTGAVAANLANNLPAYLLLESAADDPVRLGALLIGVNAGPLITPWASLATLLWHARVVAAGVSLSWARYALLGLAGAPLVVGAAVLALAATTV